MEFIIFLWIRIQLHLSALLAVLLIGIRRIPMSLGLMDPDPDPDPDTDPDPDPSIIKKKE